MMDLNKAWPELTAIILFSFAFIFVAAAVKNTIILILLGFLWGLMFGRLWYRCQGKFKLPWIIMIAGFILGFIFAAFARRYNGLFIFTSLLLFGIGMWTSYKAHKNGILKSSEY